MNTQAINKLERYSVIAMVLVALAGFMAKPVFANESCQRGHWDHAKRAEFFKKRETELHDKLQLTQTQEADWNTFIAKVTPGEHPAKASRDEMAKLPAPERMQQMLTMRQQMLQKMQARVDATKEFYSHLTTEQRQIFDESFQHHRHHAEDRG
jgi:hypothetical protein